jgi:alpha-L-rhamnosidase
MMRAWSKLGWSAPGFDASGWEPVSTINGGFDHLIAQENDACRITQELKPQAVLKTPKGETFIDMGQNMVGWVRFTVEENEGTIITVQHAEVLDRDGNFYSGNLRSAKQTVMYTCRGGAAETYEPIFSFQGFRYIKVEGASYEDWLDRITGCVIHTDMAESGAFNCSDEMLNLLQRNIVWGQRGNFLDVPTDCPQRDERLGWTGDAQVFIRTAAFNYNVVPFFEKWLKDLSVEQLPDGGVSHVVPCLEIAGKNSAAWSDAAVICPWTLYECYGDIRVLQKQYRSMKAWVDYIRAQGSDEYLWNTGFHFGDWLALDAKENSYFGATPKDLIATAYNAYSASLVAKTAAVLGKQEEAAAYADLHKGIVKAFRAEFVTPNGRVASPTQTAYVLALMFDLLEEGDRARAAGMLAENIKENGTRLTTGFVGTPYLCQVLSRFGYSDLAYQLVLQQEYPSWLYSITKGATTIWEHWDGIKQDGSFWSDDMNSFNHYAYGSIGDWLYRFVCGIDTDTAEGSGYKRIRIAPHIGEALSHAAASLNTMYGLVESSWEKRNDGSLSMSVTIPANTMAEIVLFATVVDKVTESGNPVRQSAGIHAVEQTERGVHLLTGSGKYNFVVA